tara:strand:- start:433 stop:840 length:408 start_codon:yes stop_codon:yes gene_type:complete
MTNNFPKEFKSKLPSSHSNAPYSDYVNAKGSDKSAHFHFERETDGSFLGYATERPIWNVKHTVDGFNYEVVGCVTAFDGDEVRCTFRLPEQFNPFGEDENVQEFTASGSHPFEAFENAVGQFVVFSINADRGGVL